MADPKWWLELYKAEGPREYGEREDAMALAAYSALLQGKLEPLAAFLRKGYALPVSIRRELVHSITGEDDPDFRLSLIKARRGPGNAVTKLGTDLRNLKIGLFIQERLAANNNQAEATFAAAMEHFGEERGVVVAAWSNFKKSSWFKSDNSGK